MSNTPELPNNILKRLDNLVETDLNRTLKAPSLGVDFTSNDYLGMTKWIPDALSPDLKHGSGGSRLLSGNSAIHEDFETFCADHYQGESALLFSTGYMANAGILPVLAKTGDTLHYDRLVHASIRDGLILSKADKRAYDHENLNQLEEHLKSGNGNQFVLSEALFSMDGDLCDLEKLTGICKKNGAYLIFDEAHSTGIYGDQGEGLSVEKGLHEHIFLRIHTFGKSIGRQGAVVVGPEKVKQLLINQCRSFIFSTSPAPIMVQSFWESIKKVAHMDRERKKLFELSHQLVTELKTIPDIISPTTGKSPIIPIIIPGNTQVKTAAKLLQHAGFDVRPIVSPTVPKGRERLRVIVHSYNTTSEVASFVEALRKNWDKLPN